MNQIKVFCLTIKLLRAFLILVFTTWLLAGYAQTPNINFENGDFSGWVGTNSAGICSGSFMLGICINCSPTNPTAYPGFNQGPNDDPASDGTTNYSHVITTMAGGSDPNLASLGVVLPTVWPGSGRFSARTGNMWQAVGGDATGDGETMAYTYNVTANTDELIYHYASVLNDGGHGAGEQPFFEVEVLDSAGNVISGTQYIVDATTAAVIGGFNHISSASVYWCPWTTSSLLLGHYIGQRVTIVFTTRGCIPSGCAGSHYAYAYVDVEVGKDPNYGNIHVSNGCLSSGIMLSADTGAVAYTWAGPNLNSDTTRTVIIDTPGNYKVTEVWSAPGGYDTLEIDTFINQQNTINPGFTYLNSCTGDTTEFINTSLYDTGATWQWYVDSMTTVNGTMANSSYVFQSPGTHTVKLVINDGVCTVDTVEQIIIKQAPNALFITDSSVCEGSILSVAYAGNADSNAVFNWNFDGASIIAGGNQGPFQVAWNGWGNRSISLIVTDNGCSSERISNNVVVKPTPESTFNIDTPICEGGLKVVALSGSVFNSAQYNWSFGVDAQVMSGSGSGPFEVLWGSAGAKIVQLQVSLNGCGSAFSDTVIVQPCLSIEQLQDERFNIYPNPSNGDFEIGGNSAINNTRIEVYDLLGKLLYTKYAGEVNAGDIITVHLNVARGIYMIKLLSAEGWYARQLVIE